MYRELERYREALKTYITSTYHISNPTLVDLRERLLDQRGGIAQEPFLESTARYTVDRRYAEIDIPDGVAEFLSGAAKAGLIFDPPYSHQSGALERSFSEAAGARDLVVTTGTGSGKTETFLLPVLAKIANEALTNSAGFQTRAVRALLLYPMNALVNDQLARLRLLFGSDYVSRWFTERTGRPLKFGRYTGRTLYPGRRKDDTNKHREKLESLKFYMDLEHRIGVGDEEAIELVQELRDRGKWPAKPDSAYGADDGVSRWYGTGSWIDTATGDWRRAVERTEDPELLLRHEVQDAVPDLLVTNYSMLEYMLLRPIERTIFEDTRAYYAANRDAALTLVLDEAHLYRGAQGTEVAMLIRRLRNRLGLEEGQLDVICTSASFSNPTAAGVFAARLAGKAPSSFEVLTGDKLAKTPSGAGDEELGRILAGVDLDELRSADVRARLAAVMPLLELQAECLERPSIRIASLERSVSARLTCLGIDLSVVDVEVVLAPAQELVLDDELLAVLGGRTDGGALEVRVGRQVSLTISRDNTRVAEHGDPVQGLVFQALSALPVVARLVNLTSGAAPPDDPACRPDGNGPAQSITRLAQILFPGSEQAHDATDVLVELASLARPEPSAPPLLAARVHAFFRGLPGLWACADPRCTAISDEQRSTWGGRESPTGALYAQPRRSCECGARVFELFTCRTCGSAFFRTFSEDPADPDYLWAEDVGEVDDVDGVVQALFLALEPPNGGESVTEYLDPMTGRLIGGGNTRPVWRPVVDTQSDTPAGEFSSCPCCTSEGRNIMDHVTKGDEPFQEIVRAQLLEQPPRVGSETPLQGRKSLIFSDGRQLASRLAGKMQQYSLRDAIRPILLDGFRLLATRYDQPFTLDHTYLALLVSCAHRGVHLRPRQAPFFDEDLGRVTRQWRNDCPRAELLQDSAEFNSSRVNKALMSAAYPVLTDRHTGLSALGLATVLPALDEGELAALGELPAPPVPGLDEDDAREQLLAVWLRAAFADSALYLLTTPSEWIDSDDGARIKRTQGRFPGSLKDVLGSRWFNQHLKSQHGLDPPWVAFVKRVFGSNATANGYLLRGRKVTLTTDVEWARCERCTTAQPASSIYGTRCAVKSGRAMCQGKVLPLAPGTDRVFRSRKLHFRQLWERLIAEGEHGYAPHPFVAAEHSAALGDPGSTKAVARAEWHELRFQDLDVEGPDGTKEGSIDVLSCTTTMEVGIDIGSLTAVALRNVPPGRANYQQRAGRAGRRGSALSTVVTFCGADSHDQEFFASPAAMISGPIPDPVLNLDNLEIVERHGFSLMLSMYQQVAVKDEGALTANVFESLGMLREFSRGGVDSFSFAGLVAWLAANEAKVLAALTDIVPGEVREGNPKFVGSLPDRLLAALRDVDAGPSPVDVEDDLSDDLDALAFEASDDDGGELRLVLDFDDTYEFDDRPTGVATDDLPMETEPDAVRDPEKLLDRLFDRGVLPRYAFPTDVVTFHVFDVAGSTTRRAKLRYSPQRGLNQALSSYAPGREVWVNGERHYSFAVWTPFGRKDCWQAWYAMKVYFECSRCGYAKVEQRSEEHFVEQVLDCPACGGPGTLGPAMRWFRPPGFAHPKDLEAGLALDDSPTVTRPTSAKLSAPFTDGGEAPVMMRQSGGAGYSAWTKKEHLVLTNTGSRDPRRPGFLYCPQCGRAEPNGWMGGKLNGSHSRPNPDIGNRNEICSGRPVPVVMGNQFWTDVTLIRFKMVAPVGLPPGSVVAKITLTTVAQALAAAAATTLGIEQGDIGADYRVAMTDAGERGLEVEVYLYDLAAGGAGFSRAAAERLDEVIEETIARLERCTCTHSCYDCLRSYRNKWDHALLDRKLASAFLRHVTEGLIPQVDEQTRDRLLEALALDLESSGVLVERHADALAVTGRSVQLKHPLITMVDSTDSVVIDSLIVDRALPEAARRATGPIVTSAAPKELTLPSFLKSAESGIPVYDLTTISGAGLGTPIGFAEVPDAPSGSFIGRLDVGTVHRLHPALAQGAWVVFSAADTIADGRKVQLLATPGVSFSATGRPWTVGTPRVLPEKSGARVAIKYNSDSIRARREQRPQADILVLGTLSGVFTRGVLQRI